MTDDADWRSEWKPRKPKKWGKHAEKPPAPAVVSVLDGDKPGRPFPKGKSGNPKGTTREIFDATWTAKRLAAIHRPAAIKGRQDYTL